ncbi:MAG TPA: hypothetical protein VF021_05820 [Longimicrobiales bacterium]
MKEHVREIEARGRERLRARVRALGVADDTRAGRRRPWLIPALTVALLSLLATGLYRVTHGPSREVVTLAVLPLQLDTTESSQQFLAAGIADAIITRLSEQPELRVRPTRSVLGYASTGIDIKRAGDELDVDYLLTGSVQRLPKQIEVHLQLISTPESAVRWGRTYRMPVGQLSTLQDSVAVDLSNALQVTASTPRHAAAAVDSTTYELYLHARALLAQDRDADLREAADLLERTIAQSQNFAPAYAGLAVASAEMQLRSASTQDAGTWAERAVANARRALRLDPSLAEAHQALAAVHRRTELEWVATIRESRKAIALDPNPSAPYFYMGSAYYHLGLLKLARAAVREGIDNQPQVDDGEALRTLGTIELANGNYGRAITLLQDVQRYSDHPVADPHLAAAYFYSGDVTRARALLGVLVHESTTTAATRGRALLASILALHGQRDSAQLLLSEALRGVIDHDAAYSIGAAYAQLGQSAEAVKWLQTAVDTGFQTYPWYERDPLLDPLRRNTAFRSFMHGFKLNWQQAHRTWSRPDRS